MDAFSDYAVESQCLWLTAPSGFPCDVARRAPPRTSCRCPGVLRAHQEWRPAGRRGRTCPPLLTQSRPCRPRRPTPPASLNAGGVATRPEMAAELRPHPVGPSRETDAKPTRSVDIHANTVATAEEYRLATWLARTWRASARRPTRWLRWVSFDPIPVSSASRGVGHCRILAWIQAWSAKRPTLITSRP